MVIFIGASLESDAFSLEKRILNKIFISFLNQLIMWRLLLLFCLGIGACNSDAINPFLQESEQEIRYPDTSVLQLRPLISVKYALNDSAYFVRNFSPENRLLSEIHYLNGKQDGPEKHWAASGQLLLDAYWLTGHIWGEYTEWYPSGLKKEQSTYNKEGKLLSRQVWHPNGQLESKAYYVNGEIDGRVLHYLENGRIGEIFYYSKGAILSISVENEVETEVPSLLSASE